MIFGSVYSYDFISFVGLEYFSIDYLSDLNILNAFISENQRFRQC